MNRDRAFNRKQRFKHIRKRMKMAVSLFDNHWYEENNGGGYLADHAIGCSCVYCSPRTRNKGKRRYKQSNYTPSINYKHSDAVKIDRMDRDLQDFESC